MNLPCLHHFKEDVGMITRTSHMVRKEMLYHFLISIGQAWQWHFKSKCAYQHGPFFPPWYAWKTIYIYIYICSGNCLFLLLGQTRKTCFFAPNRSTRNTIQLNNIAYCALTVLAKIRQRITRGLFKSCSVCNELKMCVCVCVCVCWGGGGGGGIKV